MTSEKLTQAYLKNREGLGVLAFLLIACAFCVSTFPKQDMSISVQKDALWNATAIFGALWVAFTVICKMLLFLEKGRYRIINRLSLVFLVLFFVTGFVGTRSVNFAPVEDTSYVSYAAWTVCLLYWVGLDVCEVLL